MSLKQIDKQIKQITTNSQKLNDLIHETAVLILEHAKEHGDCSRAQVLVMALPASMRRTMLIAWFSEFSPIVTKNSNDWNAQMHKEQTALGKDNPLFRPFNIEAAKELPFWKMAEAQREQDREPLTFSDIVKMVERLGKQIEKRIEDGEVADDDVESAKEIARAVEGLQFHRVKVEAERQTANDADGGTVVTGEPKERAAA